MCSLLRSCKIDIEVEQQKSSTMALIDYILFGAILFGIYKFLTKNDDFFKRRGVKNDKPVLFVGNMLDFLIGRVNAMNIFQNACDKFSNEK